MKPWSLPIGALVIGVVWILWLARGAVLSDDTDNQSPPSLHAARPEAPRARDHARLATNPTLEAPVPAVAPRPTSPIEPALKMAVQAPASAVVGEGFDLRVGLDARMPVKRVAVEIAYDPALLKARTLEEMDYTQRAPAERAFRIEQGGDGQVEVALSDGPGNSIVALPPSAALVQFEALASGRAEIRITRITVTDPTNKAVASSITGTLSEVVIR